MSYIVVDVEADGPAVGLYSMVCFGAVIVDPKLDKTFYGETSPISEKYIPDALAVSGFTRENHLTFPKPKVTMSNFYEWVTNNTIGKPVFISDNPAFDWQWINFYFHAFKGENPFGFSARRIGDLYCGLTRNLGANRDWKRLRRTKHTHNPVDDAKGNAEALLEIGKRYGLKF